ncbi:EamA family transporter [Albidovulum sediminicola]|uniref:EamA family transporter n=1 Tax=Albidovulum sediminicola TaxID=2984331 RepID=A0ABT2Z424_9RHOB|nr:EamA family transporter [Defluviimonas sp. WL0075]MCV2865904.1 EamA family transporter [Defluviimonas sp. WL0075]
MRAVGERSGICLVLLAAALWATVGVGARIAPSSAGLPPEVLGLARTAIAGPVILLIATALLGLRAVTATRLDPLRLLIFAASNAVFQIGLFRCFTLLGVTVTVFLTVCLPPVLAMIASWLRRREPVSAGSAAALALALTGLLLIADDGLLRVRLAGSGEGLLTAVLAAVAFVAMSDAARSLGRGAPPLVVAGTGLSCSSVFLMLFLPIVTKVDVSGLAAGLSDPRFVGLVLYLGLGPTALAYVCYCAGIARCRSALVGLIASMIEPAIAACLAVWVLSDRLSTAETGGCALLMMSMLVLWLSERMIARKRRPAVAAAPRAG